MELSVYHLAIITVIAFLFFFISFTMSYNNEQATKQYRGGVASRVGTGSKKGSRAKALYAGVLI